MLYGQRGQGSGRMPGFGDNPNTETDEKDGIFSDGMLRAVACYEASLGGERVPGCANPPAEPTPTSTSTTTAGAAGTGGTTTTTREP